MVALIRKGALSHDLSGVYLGASDLRGLDLSGINFDDGILVGTNFTEATLVGDSFIGANLAGTKFIRADLRNAKFTSSEEMGRFGRHRDYIDRQMRGWPATGPIKYGLGMPKFDCSDLRGADFKGHTLFFMTVDHFRWPAPAMLNYAPEFRGANLKGTDLREIQFVQISAKDSDSMAFPVTGGFGNELSKGYEESKYQIAPQRPLSPSNAKEFSWSLGKISFKFRGSNWQDAQLPRAVREYLEEDPPPKDQFTDEPCKPRAAW